MTQEIQKQIEDIQQNTKTAIKAIDSVADVIGEVNSISQTIVSAVEEQSADVQEISVNVDSVSTGVLQVSRNVTGSARGLTEVSEEAADVNSAVADTARKILQVKDNAQTLSGLSGNLRGLLEQFRV